MLLQSEIMQIKLEEPHENTLTCLIRELLLYLLKNACILHQNDYSNGLYE